MDYVMPKRIQRKRTKGWRSPDGAINVTRPTIWGNPFVHEDPAEAVAAYEMLVGGGSLQFNMGPNALRFASNVHPITLHHAFPEFVRERIHHLRGKDLMCWCSLDKPCHADVLIRLANATN